MGCGASAGITNIETTCQPSIENTLKPSGHQCVKLTVSMHKPVVIGRVSSKTEELNLDRSEIMSPQFVVTEAANSPQVSWSQQKSISYKKPSQVLNTTEADSKGKTGHFNHISCSSSNRAGSSSLSRLRIELAHKNLAVDGSTKHRILSCPENQVFRSNLAQNLSSLERLPRNETQAKAHRKRQPVSPIPHIISLNQAEAPMSNNHKPPNYTTKTPVLIPKPPKIKPKAETLPNSPHLTIRPVSKTSQNLQLNDSLSVFRTDFARCKRVSSTRKNSLWKISSVRVYPLAEREFVHSTEALPEEAKGLTPLSGFAVARKKMVGTDTVPKQFDHPVLGSATTGGTPNYVIGSVAIQKTRNALKKLALAKPVGLCLSHREASKSAAVCSSIPPAESQL